MSFCWLCICPFLVNFPSLQALYYAKEAHRLRTRLFQEKFTYSVEQETEKHIEAGDHTQKLAYGLSNLQVKKSAASELWYSDTISLDFEDSYISPWKILQCYLESTLQVVLSLTCKLLIWKFHPYPMFHKAYELIWKCRLELSMK